MSADSRSDDGREYDPEVFFKMRPESVFLETEAAARACEMAAERSLAVVRVEGGIWQNGQFEARLDAIWDGLLPPMSRDEAVANNAQAALIIRDDNEGCNAFVLSAGKI